MIYFVTMHFDREVHAQALGFTWVYYQFSTADDQETARKQCCDYYEKRYNLKVIKSSISLSTNQDINRYVFKEQIVGSKEFHEEEARRAHQLPVCSLVVAQMPRDKNP
jgi:hypothetical protein